MSWTKTVLILMTISNINCQSSNQLSVPATTNSISTSAESRFVEKCNARFDAFRRNWTRGQLRLTSFLDDLKTWNCSQFLMECEKRTYALNNFTTLVYDRFCNYTRFESFCMNDTPNGTANTTKLEVPSTCQQVLMYNSSQDYVEFILEHIPFCDLVWCGFSSKIAKQLRLSAWSCMLSRCRTNIIVIMAVSGGMALLTILVNLIVIAVIVSYPNSNSRQLIFKLCLAAGDLMCGFIVLPTFISTLYIHFVSPRNIFFPSQNETSNFSFIGYENPYSTTSLYNASNSSAAVIRYHEGQEDPKVTEIFPSWYLPFVGTMTAWSMMVTLYTLFFASMDQLRSFFKPLSLSVNAALKMARFLSVLTWFVSFVLAVLPVFITSLTPYEVITGLVIARGQHAVLFYCLTFLLPLVTTWIFNVSCWIKVKKNNKSTIKNKDSENVQIKLITTLTAMTALFTVCVLLSGIAIVIHVADHHDVDKVIENRAENLRLYAFELIATLILLSKGIWYCFLYNIRSKPFRNLTADRLRVAIFSCCFYECCRKVQMNVRKVRRRVQTLLL